MKFANLILALCILLGTLFLCGLGMWQLKRLAWKEALIERVHANMDNEPLSVAQVEAMIDAGEDIEYRPVTVTGWFHYSFESHYFATHKSKPGYFVYTPLQQDNGAVILVNRGYVPMDKKAESTREEGRGIGVFTIVGLARSAPTSKPNVFVPDNDTTKNVFYWKSITEMFNMGKYGGTKDGIEPSFNRFFIDANDAPVPGGLPVGGVTLIQFPNSHLQYAFTWFGLAGALLLVGGVFLRSRLIGKA